MEGKRTLWTRLADAFFVAGRHGPLWWRLLCQVELHMWALRRVRRQWYNGYHWIERGER